MGRRRRPTTIDQFVGRRICERRIELGITQRELAQHLGIAPFTVSEYESSAKSVSAALLYEIAGLLDVSPGHFFEGFEDHRATNLPARQRLFLTFMRSLAEIDNKAYLEVLGFVVRALAGRE